MKKRFLSLLLAGTFALSVPVCAEDYKTLPLEELQEAYAELLSDYEELQKEYDELKAKEETTEADTKEAKESAAGSEDFILERDNGIMKYVKHEITTDYQGNNAVVLYFNYTNTSGSSANALFAFMPKVFQNGVQCKNAVIMNDIPEIAAASTEVQDGISIDVAYAYNISDMSELTIELNEVISFDDPISATISLE